MTQCIMSLPKKPFFGIGIGIQNYDVHVIAFFDFFAQCQKFEKNGSIKM